MDQTENQSSISKSVLVVLAILVLGAISFGYFFSGNIGGQLAETTNEQVTETTLNVPKLPEGFPIDIPIEETIVESAAVGVTNGTGKQLSVSYESPKSVAQKFAEYKAYMLEVGYKVNENEANSIKTIFGARSDANIAIVLSSRDGKTLVQLSYITLN